MLCEHRVKVEATDNVMVLPKPTDPRVAPWIDQLIDMGLMDEDMGLTYESDCTSGVLGMIDTITGEHEEYYFWRIKWEDEHAHKE